MCEQGDGEANRRDCDLCKTNKAEFRCTECGRFVCEDCKAAVRPAALDKESDDEAVERFLDSVSVRCRACREGD